MGQLSDIDKIRKKRRRKLVAQRILLLILLTLAGAVLYLFKDEIPTIGVVDYIEDFAAGLGSGEGYPMEFGGEQVKQTYQMGGNLLVLTDSNLYIFNGSGKEIRNIQHKYSNPVVKIGGSRILIYDRGGKKLRVESLARTIDQKEFDFAIYAGAISSQGEVAVAMGAQRFLAEVNVYDRTMQWKFTWQSPSNYITALSFSRGGRELAAAGVNAREGDLLSSLRLYRLDEKEPLSTMELPGELIHAVSDCREGIQIITDHRQILLSDKGAVLQEYDYQYETLVTFDQMASGHTALLFGDYRENKNSDLVVLNADCTPAFEISISSHAQFVNLGKTRVGVIVDGQLTGYDFAGTLTGSEPLTFEPLALQMIDRDAYIITPDSIEKITLP